MSESSEQPCSVEVAGGGGGGDEDESLVPKVGMVFDSDEKAYQFYCRYGEEVGFSVRKHVVKRRSSGVVSSRIFCCFKEGFCRTGNKRRRTDGRSGCEAYMAIRIMKDGRYRVSEFKPSHNHELLPKYLDIVTNSVDDSEVSRNAERKRVDGRSTNCSLLKSHIPAWNSMRMGDDRVEVVCVQQMLAEGQAGKPSLELGDATSPVGNDGVECPVPKIGMEFDDDEEAYQFYVNYGMGIGFSIRRHIMKRRSSGIIYSRVYVCNREGYTRKKDGKIRRPKPCDRTGCPAYMTIKITKNGRYHVTEFEPKHNHPLVILNEYHLFKWQGRRRFRKPECDSDDSAAELWMPQKSSKEHLDEQDSGHKYNLLFRSYRNHVPSVLRDAMRKGDVGAMMQYVQKKQTESPSFYYALQQDRNDRLTNLFWSDAKSMVDFNYFGDVVCLDTTYKLSNVGRPFALFLGLNHHKQVIIFGATFLYDESEESFKWLFHTFKMAMSGKQPKVVLTDRSEGMSNAIASVWPGTIQRLCVWQIFHNAAKHLNSIFQGSTTFKKDFCQCVYDCEDEDEFHSQWQTMLSKYELTNNDWLAQLYEDRERWSLAHGRETFCADMKSSLIKERLNVMLHQYLNQKSDLFDFFKRYERMLGERRHAELQADIFSGEKILKMPSSRMLKQAMNAYTPEVFKMFRREFELSMDCMVHNCGKVKNILEFKVTIDEQPKEYFVKYDSANVTVVCSCKKFEFTGIQCRHALKVLDIVNIKELPPQYILKRWTNSAKVANLREDADFLIHEGPKLSEVERFNSLCRIFNKIAVRAAESMESCTFIESISDQLMDQVYQVLQMRAAERP